MEELVLKTSGLTKRFGTVLANNNINMEIGPQEVHAIIGENGAGKSTFCKMLTGIYTPTSGEIYLMGKKLNTKSVAGTMSSGISMVYQERNLIGNLTGAQNIVLGREPMKSGTIDEKKTMEIALGIRSKLGIDTPLDVPVQELGAGAQQLIEIMRALITEPKLLILDEPTASLGEGEVEPFIEFIKSIKQSMNLSVIFISHKIEEVFNVADHITVFTDGSSVYSAKTSETTQEECIRYMIRSDKIKPIVVPEKDLDSLEHVLEVEQVSYNYIPHETKFYTARGEIVGFYGLVGSGRTEMLECLYGLRASQNLSYRFGGETITNPTPHQMIGRGMVMTSELRRNCYFPNLDLQDNICCLFIERFASRRGLMKFKEMRSFTQEVLEKNAVKHRDSAQKMSELSGGNMQKVIIGRSIEVEGLTLLILDEPTNGMDIGAKNEIVQKVRRLVDEEQKSVIFVSSELDELLSACDRLYVFFRGNIVQEFRRNAFNKEAILDVAVRGGGKYRV